MGNKKLNFYASNSHFLDHMVPIWNKLSDEYKGNFYVTKLSYGYANKLGIEAIVGLPPKGITIVASYNDYRKTIGDVIYMEHGIGNTYGNNHPSYAGGLGKNRVVMFLNQHSITQEKNIKSYPDAINIIIGTPKMDSIKTRHISGRVVCLSFHWDCKVMPETRSAYDYYHFIIPKLLSSDKYTLIMHAHPHMNGEWQQNFKKLKVKFYENFSDILEIADIYAVDNSSTMYEFAAAGRPILALNCPFYRKDVNYGIRFWDYIPGQQVDNYHDLPDIIEYTFDNPHEWDERRSEIVDKLYPYRGQSTKMAVDAIKEYLDNA